jgi:hypothetical protein
MKYGILFAISRIIREFKDYKIFDTTIGVITYYIVVIFVIIGIIGIMFLIISSVSKYIKSQKAKNRGQSLIAAKSTITEQTDNIKLSAMKELTNRILCSDESCIGTIGKNGKCRVCGKPFE